MVRGPGTLPSCPLYPQMLQWRLCWIQFNQCLTRCYLRGVCVSLEQVALLLLCVLVCYSFLGFTVLLVCLVSLWWEAWCKQLNGEKFYFGSWLQRAQTIMVSGCGGAEQFTWWQRCWLSFFLFPLFNHSIMGWSCPHLWWIFPSPSPSTVPHGHASVLGMRASLISWVF